MVLWLSQSQVAKALCRQVVYSVPVSLEGLAAVAGEPLDCVLVFARSWQDRAFAYQETGRIKEPLWTFYGLLKGWLLGKLSPEERTDAHRAAGDFLVEMDRQDRESELGLSWVDCLMEARTQYFQAEEFELARTVTDRLSGFLVRSGLYDDVRQLNAELLNHEVHPSPMNWIARTYLDQGEYDSARIWYQRSIEASAGQNQEEAIALHGLATIDVRKGDYEAAREKFEKSMKIRQQIGDRAGEAATWHALATIDFRKGDYDAAPDKFDKSLKIKQQIGNRAGEAATFYQLGILAHNQGRSQEGIRLVALCCGIDASIGQVDTESDFKALSAIASELSCTQEQIDAAFPKVAPDVSSHSRNTVET